MSPYCTLNPGSVSKLIDNQGAGAREPGAAPGQRDPAQGPRVFCHGGARPPVADMIAFIDDHRRARGVEPICEGVADRNRGALSPCRSPGGTFATLTPRRPATSTRQVGVSSDPGVTRRWLPADPARARVELRRLWRAARVVCGKKCPGGDHCCPLHRATRLPAGAWRCNRQLCSGRKLRSTRVLGRRQRFQPA